MPHYILAGGVLQRQRARAVLSEKQLLSLLPDYEVEPVLDRDGSAER